MPLASRHHRPPSALAWLLLLSGCASAPLPEAPTAPAPAAFSEAAAAAPDARAMPADGPWWTAFADPALDALIQRANESNTSLQQAAARLAQARAAAQAAGAAGLPQVGLSAAASRQGGPLVNAAGGDGSLFSLGASLSYDLDPAARQSRTAQAARLDALQREALLRHARLQVQAEVAATWFTLRGLDAELALLQDAARSQRQAVRLHEGRQRAGLAAAQEAARARAEAASLDAQASAVARQRAAQLHALSFLLGGPQVLPTEDMHLQAGTRAALPQIPAGIPSQVLARRPDVAAAERAMQAARQRLGVAQSAWLPSLTLTMSGGAASAELAELLRSSARSWGLAGLLTLPLFDGGRREAGVAAAQADLELAAASWREQMLLALRDVDDQLSALRLLAEQASALQAAQDDAAQAVALAASRQARGLASQLEVLEAERSALRDRRTALQVQAARQLATVGLVRALGGGWSSTPDAALAAVGR